MLATSKERFISSQVRFFTTSKLDACLQIAVHMRSNSTQYDETTQTFLQMVLSYSSYQAARNISH